MTAQRLVVIVAASLAFSGPVVSSNAVGDDVYAAFRANRVVPPAPAPDVSVPFLEGGRLDLAQLRGKVVMIGFFVTT